MATNYEGVRYDASAKHGHVESYFLKANDPKSRRALWIKATIYATDREPSKALAEAWAIAFDGDREHVAVKSHVPFASARFDRTAMHVDVDSCTIDRDHARGKIETSGRSVAWDLSLAGATSPLVHFPRAWMYEAPFPSSKIVSPLPDIRVSGTVVVNGETWTLDRWPGLVGHNWGRSHAFLYAWAHCNVWDDAGDEVVFEGTSARVRVGRGKLGVLAPMTTLLCVRHRGVRYELNGARDLVRNRGSISARRWTFSGKNELVSIEGELCGENDDFVGLFYANPDGAMTYCLNSKIARGRVTIVPRGRAPIVLSTRAAALEIGTRDPNHGVRMYV
jgi:hypothetical protein